MYTFHAFMHARMDAQIIDDECALSAPVGRTNQLGGEINDSLVRTPSVSRRMPLQHFTLQPRRILRCNQDARRVRKRPYHPASLASLLSKACGLWVTLAYHYLVLRCIQNSEPMHARDTRTWDEPSKFKAMLDECTDTVKNRLVRTHAAGLAVRSLGGMEKKVNYYWCQYACQLINLSSNRFSQSDLSSALLVIIANKREILATNPRSQWCDR